MPYEGAYGVSVTLLKNISKYCETCNDKVKMDAEIYGDDQLDRIINLVASEELVDDLN